MCLTLFSSGKMLDIPLAVETIRLKEDANSSITIDFFLHNKSNQSVKELDVLYPRPFLVWTRNEARRSVLNRLGWIKDISHTLTDISSDENWFYSEGLAHGEWDYDRRTRNLKITLPDPYAPDNPLTLEGGVENNEGAFNHFNPEKNTENRQRLALMQKTHSALFTYQLGIPLEPNASGWFRWRIDISEISAPLPMDCLPCFDIRRFNISGPKNVLEDFEDALDELLSEAQKRAKLTSGSMQFVKQQREAFGSLTKDSKTKYDRYIINLFPLHYSYLPIPPIWQGGVEPLGILPNELPGRPFKTKYCYQWKAVDANNSGIGDFRISFTGMEVDSDRCPSGKGVVKMVKKIFH